jgi:hypothetical protein
MNEGEAEGKETARQIKQSVEGDAEFPENKSANESSTSSDKRSA